MRQTRRERVNIPVGPVGAFCLAGKPVFRDASWAGAIIAHQMIIDVGQKARMLVDHHLAEIRDLGDLPQAFDGIPPGCQRFDLRIACHQRQSGCVCRVARAHQPLGGGWHVQAVEQMRERREIEVAVAPHQHPDGIKPMFLNILDLLLVQRRGLACDTEGAVIHVAAGASCNLGDLGRGQGAVVAAVEFFQAGEGHMVHIHVETHADRVCCDDEIHIARLIEGHLGIAGAWRQGPHHHGGTAAIAPDQLGNGVDLVGGKGDDGGAARQAGDLL